MAEHYHIHLINRAMYEVNMNTTSRDLEGWGIYSMPAVPTSKDFEKLQKYSSPSVNPRQHVFTPVHQVSIVIKQQEK